MQQVSKATMFTLWKKDGSDDVKKLSPGRKLSEKDPSVSKMAPHHCACLLLL